MWHQSKCQTISIYEFANCLEWRFTFLYVNMTL